MRSVFAFATCVLLLALATQASAEEKKIKDSNSAPPLTSAGWIGTPVSLEAIRGNTIVLAFWNADVAC